MKSAAVILTNFRRPENIPRQLGSLKAMLEIFDVFLIDNADHPTNLRKRMDVEGWYTYIENGRNLGAGFRFLFSSSLPHDFIIAVDDDVFPTVHQLSLIYEGLRREPLRVHGLWGLKLDLSSTSRRLKGGIREHGETVHVVSRVYGYTPETAFKSVAIAHKVGFASWREIGPTDDILLSAASVEPPWCHGINELTVCETSDKDGIATWKSEGFFRRRNQLIDELLTLGLLSPSYDHSAAPGII
jgi:hypothetical protein